ncbi:DUF1684 domain-containing protein [Bryobacter aggregatus]|uniref:DUF1684 domain-containing protein n=1 Tax=Bryobacter aggregatus TaxID=360054 RepID=UPI0006922356|nr:DUF1684 domain-containing protein [Bryobacter aggregatus]
MPIKSWVIPAIAMSMSLSAADPAYEKSILEYRKKIETTLKSDTGWLTVAGLYWLKPGNATVGSAPESDVVLPEGKAPKKVGVFHFDGKKVQLSVERGVSLQMNGKPFAKGVLGDDGNGRTADIASIGDLSLTVIERGGKYGIRLRDKSSKYRREFTHRSWFPVKAEYKVTGKFLPYATPKKLKVATVIDGVIEDHESPGEIAFALAGQQLKAQVLKGEEPNELWLIFRDRSSGKTTYPAARYLYGIQKPGNVVEFDFNKAYNPPCAFTPFATCPLPVRQNWLPIAIEAGELNYHTDK